MQVQIKEKDKQLEALRSELAVSRRESMVRLIQRHIKRTDVFLRIAIYEAAPISLLSKSHDCTYTTSILRNDAQMYPAYQHHCTDSTCSQSSIMQAEIIWTHDTLFVQEKSEKLGAESAARVAKTEEMGKEIGDLKSRLEFAKSGVAFWHEDAVKSWGMCSQLSKEATPPTDMEIFYRMLNQPLKQEVQSKATPN